MNEIHWKTQNEKWNKKLTHPALVWVGPWRAFELYSLKYSGTENPKKRATPVIKRFLIEFMLVNCKNDSPTEAAKRKNCHKRREVERK